MTSIALILAIGLSVAAGALAQKAGGSYNVVAGGCAALGIASLMCAANFPLMSILLMLGEAAVLLVALLMSSKRPDPASSADALFKYKRLLDEGVITQEEFAQKKHELMDAS